MNTTAAQESDMKKIIRENNLKNQRENYGFWK